MDIPLDEVIYFDAITSRFDTGAATDADSTPTFEVFEEATDTDIGVGGNLTKRTSKTGNYRGSFTASAANGFEVGKWYSVIGSATVNSVAGKGVLKTFRIVAAEAIAGKPKVDVDGLLGTAWETPAVAGRPDVNAKAVSNDTAAADTLELFAESLDQSTGQVDAGTFAAGAIDNAAIASNAIGAAEIADGAITAAKIATDAIDADALAADAVTEIQSGLATSSALTTLTNIFSGITSLAQWLGLIAGKQTGNSTARTELRATGAGSGTFDETTDSLEANRDNIGTAGAGLTEAGGDGDHLTAIDLPDQTMNITGNLSGSVGSVTGAVGSVTGAVGSVTGNVGGNVTGSIGSLATQAKADVNSEVDTALADIHLDHLLATDYDPASKPGTATALLNELIGDDGGVSQFTENALELAPTGSGSTPDAIADEIEGRLLGNALTIVSPVRDGGTVKTIQNTAYDNDYGNRIEWPDTNDNWPTLSSATITVKIGQGGTPLTFTGVVVTATGSDKRVGLELTEAQSLSIDVNSAGASTGWRYLVYATIGTDDIALAQGRWISESQPV